ncbi:hypothetical protein [Phytoactinopolyspora halotolerans]|uniref:Uncharacterized protein n=1 Tax=Phytoactinopolyspora halotolerans TaxID=1981512 RepID=A0A6L9SHA0_9ACTN|nr:hypothetical protein [Phytoactinopolyspora halotolerans]NEE04559.1 hypothetical protein [Phytoactinopolyspora halotolerans]
MGGEAKGCRLPMMSLWQSIDIQPGSRAVFARQIHDDDRPSRDDRSRTDPMSLLVSHGDAESASLIHNEVGNRLSPALDTA